MTTNDESHGHSDDSHGSKPHGADATFFSTRPGSDGFCDAKVLKFRMKGREFHWARVGGCKPAGGGYFEIRVKGGKSLLVPPTPKGVNDIYCEVDPSVPEGTVIEYSLYQVRLEGGKPIEKELHDPELEIGF
jgi:hypothetical protein